MATVTRRATSTRWHTVVSGWAVLSACSTAPAEPPAAKPLPPPSVIRAAVGPPKVVVPSATHKVEDPLLAWYDHNIYPANNGVVLQGAACGPIGDQASATFWLVAVHDYQSETGPSHLEAAMVYDVDCDDCPGDETTTAEIGSKRAPPGQPAHLLGVSSMTISDPDNDGQYEVIAEATFKPCCGTEAERQPYQERVVLEVSGTTILRTE